MSDFERRLLIFLGLLAIAFGLWLEYSVWDECRKSSSFIYCLRVMS